MRAHKPFAPPVLKCTRSYIRTPHQHARSDRTANSLAEVGCIGIDYCPESLYPIGHQLRVAHLVQKVPLFFLRGSATRIPEIYL